MISKNQDTDYKILTTRLKGEKKSLQREMADKKYNKTLTKVVF